MFQAQQHYRTRATASPQSEPIPGRETEMAKNNAGGFVFEVDDWARLDRFLMLGTEGGSYYSTEKEMTRDAAKAVERCIAADGPRTVARIVEISVAGRAPKNDPALFALAMCAGLGDLSTKRAALAALPKVARIGTHLFHFAAYVEAFRGWGRGLKNAIALWYLDRSVDSLAKQAVKYRQRDGWSHRDLLRLAHPATNDGARAAVFDWVCRGADAEALPVYIKAADALAKATDGAAAAEMIRAHDLPREAVPTELLNDREVWKALLERMPPTAMIRNLGKMSALDLFKPMSAELGRVTAALGDAAALKEARVHPLQILLAHKTYEQGRGDKGSLTWPVESRIVDALDGAFYKAFQAVEPTGKRILLALDVSGSMDTSRIAGTNVTAREASAAIALVTAAVEKNHHFIGFTSAGRNDGGVVPLAISPRQRLSDVIRSISNLPHGGTDCAQPMLYAMARGIEADAFVILTDNETWAGGVHPMQALAQYRAKTGIAAKLIVVGMTATGFSIADPADAGTLDVVGFDTSTPQVISSFIAG